MCQQELSRGQQVLALKKLGISEQEFLAFLPDRGCHFPLSSKAVIKCQYDTITVTVIECLLGDVVAKRYHLKYLSITRDITT